MTRSGCRSWALCAARSAWRLAHVQLDAVPPRLIELLADEDDEVRYRTAWALGRIGPEAAAAVPRLVDALADSSAAVRRAAVWALLRMEGAGGSDAALARAIDHEDPEVRRRVAMALGGGSGAWVWPMPWPMPMPRPFP